MTNSGSTWRGAIAALVVFAALGVALVSASASVAAEPFNPAMLIERLDAFPHAERIKSSSSTVRDHEIGLSAMNKFSGDWIFRQTERLDGELARNTWQIVDSFTSARVLADLEQQLEAADDAAQLLFSCNGRACGSAAQWANRIFGERLLYGRADDQRYRVYSVRVDDDRYRVVLYSAARSSDRQYLHIDVLYLTPQPELVVEQGAG